MTNIINTLKESSDCLYIYNRNFSIYGLPDKERYTIIVSDDWELPEDWNGLDLEKYQIYQISHWFRYILDGTLVGWECACLNKKYIIKEEVKLLMKTNPLQLRRAIDLQLADYKNKGLFNINEAWKIIKNIKFSIQIIENHKIVNFKEAQNDYYNLLSFESIDEVENYINQSYIQLKKLTDGMIKQEILKKLKNE